MGGQQEAKRAYWEAKLAAEAELLDVVRQVDSGGSEYVLLDARPRDAYDSEHLPGALSIPLDEVADVAESLDPGRQFVVYCWRST
jgi:rhodanese-related sulfurtransferase